MQMFNDISLNLLLSKKTWLRTKVYMIELTE